MIKLLLKTAVASALVTMLFVSCGSTKVESAPVVAEPAEPPAAESPAPVVETPKPVAKTAADLEYERSIGTAGVSRNTFEDDKAAIQRIIRELDGVMKTLNYKSWIAYLDQESIDYWSRSANLRKAQARLPVKGLQLKTLEDYFKYVFVPARKGRDVPEIRYESPTSVKAVQTQLQNSKDGKEERKDIVYYYFNKINGKWMVHIPPLED